MFIGVLVTFACHIYIYIYIRCSNCSRLASHTYLIFFFTSLSVQGKGRKVCVRPWYLILLIFTKTEAKSKINITDIPTVNVSIFVIRQAYIRISYYLSIGGHLYVHSQSFQVPFVLFKSFKKMSETIYYSTFKTLVFFLVLKKYNVHLPMTAYLIVDIAFVRISPKSATKRTFIRSESSSKVSTLTDHRGSQLYFHITMYL
jgi:hypothetical protein